VNKGWSLDIEESFEPTSNGHINGDTENHVEATQVSGGAVENYEETIRDPSLDALQATTAETNGLKLEVSSLDPQAFLATQLEILEKIRQDSSGMDSSRLARGRQVSQSGIEGGEESHVDEGRVNEHIGPVQFNMGGIQVDADDMLQRLRVSPILPTFFNDSLTSTGPTNLPNPRAHNAIISRRKATSRQRCPAVLLRGTHEKRGRK
jgi:dynein light intermediate chain 1